MSMYMRIAAIFYTTDMSPYHYLHENTAQHYTSICMT